MRVRAVVTDVENRSAVAAVRGLAGLGLQVVGVSCTRLAPGLWSRDCAERTTAVSPTIDADGFLGSLEATLRLASPALVLAGGDASLLAVSGARDRLEPLVERGVGLPPHDVVVECLDRGVLHRAVAGTPLCAPNAVECDGLEAAAGAVDVLGLPVMVKPIRYEKDANGGIRRLGSVRVGATAELAEAVAACGGSCLLQRYEPGIVYSCGGISAGRELLGLCVSRYLRTWPVLGGNVAFSETVAPPEELVALVRSLIAQLGWEGVFELELIRRPDGSFAAIDFNPRVYGSMWLSARAGADLAALWASWRLGRDVAPRTAEAGWRYRWEEGELRYLLWQGRRGHVAQAAKVVLPRRRVVHPLASVSDPGPLMAWTLGAGIRAARARLRRRAVAARGAPGGPLPASHARGGNGASDRDQVAIVGAGPHGLAVAAHLREAGVPTRVFGDSFSFWRDCMPKGMLLRSAVRSSHIADPAGRLSLHDWAAASGRTISAPIPLVDYLDYGRWFQRQAVPDVDPRRVTRVSASNGSFALRLADGEEITVGDVVVAAGIEPFAWKRPDLAVLGEDLVSHSSVHRDLGRFAGKQVTVVGSGQSALESAALLHEEGAEVELVARAQAPWWLGSGSSNPAPRRSLHWPKAPTDIGGRVTSWISAAPWAWRHLPHQLQPEVEFRCIRPAGAGWLRPRLAQVRMTMGTTIDWARADGDGVTLQLSDGTTRRSDHVLLATGFRVQITRYPFLDPGLAAAIQTSNGYPVLGEGLESSIPGLHFVGAPAALSFGPVMRFVIGAWYAGPAVASRVTGRRSLRRFWAFAPRSVRGPGGTKEGHA